MDKSIKSDDYSTGESAVLIRNVCKSYGKKGPRILNNFCLNAKKGSIYSLLGSSGSGKTTALGCLLGISTWQSGEILIFGQKPATWKQNKLAKRIGYVPQEMSLLNHLSIKENIQFYGRLHGMTGQEISEQWLLLIKLLKLPSQFKLVTNLSGGMKRRTSLALALLHRPELLVLDEPTVGLDPLLRERVWKHLFNLAHNGTTIIITTHYIEETRNSDRIGVMRHGRLLAEDSPLALMSAHGTNLVEEVVLKLCKQDTKNVNWNSANCVPMQSTVSASDNVENMKNNNVLFYGNTHQGNSTTATDDALFQSKWKPDLEGVVVTDANLSSYGKYKHITFDSVSPAHHHHHFVAKSKKVVKNILNRGRPKWIECMFEFTHRVLATSLVIFLSLIRHPVFFIGSIALPACQVILTFACVGTNPKGLPVAIINDEITNWPTKCFLNSSNTTDTSLTTTKIQLGQECSFEELSCLYLQHLGHYDTIKMVPYNSTKAAINDVHNGDIWGYIHFSANFSQYTAERMVARNFATEESINGSTINVRMDMSEYIGSSLILKHLIDELQEYFKSLIDSCNLGTAQVEIPLQLRNAVYGSAQDSYHNYYIPGIYSNIIFLVPMCVSMLMFIGDLKSGTLERARVAGSTIGQITSAYAVTQFIVVIAQIAVCTLCIQFVFDFHIVGSLMLYTIIALLIGMCGHTLGILIAVICQDEFEGLMLAIFIATTIMLFGGILWPLACMQPLWRYIGMTLPTTLITESLRSVIARGVGITHGLLWPGVAITAGWTALFWIFVIILSCRYSKT